MNTLTIALKKVPSWAKNALFVVGASLLIGLSAHLSVPLPFTPVSIVIQNGVILLLAVFLGSRRAPASVALFLAQGMMGFPVFANGAAGIHYLLGPKGGYYFGYFIAAFLVGWIVERGREKTLLKAFIAMGVGALTIFLFGAAWLATFIGIEKAILLGVLPFLIGDFCKLVVSLKVLQWFRWDSNLSNG